MTGRAGIQFCQLLCHSSVPRANLPLERKTFLFGVITKLPGLCTSTDPNHEEEEEEEKEEEEEEKERAWDPEKSGPSEVDCSASPMPSLSDSFPAADLLHSSI